MIDDLLRGYRILLVEDERKQRDLYGDLLRKAGAVVVDASTVEAAKRVIAQNALSAAWLDVWLNEDGSEKVWPVAEMLASKGVPFLFCTHYIDEIDPAEWPGRPIIRKPLLTKRGRPDPVAQGIVSKMAQLVSAQTPSH